MAVVIQIRRITTNFSCFYGNTLSTNRRSFDATTVFLFFNNWLLLLIVSFLSCLFCQYMPTSRMR